MGFSALLAAAALCGAVEFDQGVAVTPALEEARRGASASPGAPASAASVWVSVDLAATRHPKWAALGLGRPARVEDGLAVLRVPEEALPRLAAFMHSELGRCGGFFAHPTLAEAEADLAPAKARTPGTFELDEAARVRPLMGKVSEAELRATIETLAAYRNRYYQTPTGTASAKWLRERWAALAEGIPGTSARLVAHPGWAQPSVVLTIPGGDLASETVVLGGHLDSIARGADPLAPGADDNASGIAVLTETVRLLAQSGFRPRRTIEVMAYAAEEVGLRGSGEIARGYAQQGRKVAAVIQFDMTNWGTPGEVFLLADNVDPGLTAFLGRLLDEYVKIRWSTTKCGYGCSDHASWTRAGFPASAAFESSATAYNPNIHTERDTLANSGGDAAHSVPFAKLAAAFAVETAKEAR